MDHLSELEPTTYCYLTTIPLKKEKKKKNTVLLVLVGLAC